MQAKDLAITPAEILGLTKGSYEAYCLDQAVWYLGNRITREVDKAGTKPAKGQANSEATKKAKLMKMLGEEPKKVFADPALLFQ